MSSIPKSGRVGSVVYVDGKQGKLARAFVPPRNPRTAYQQDHRKNVPAVTSRWHTLTPEQSVAWRAATVNMFYVNKAGRQVRVSGYHHFVSLNVLRADLHLPQFDLPPAAPAFHRSPVEELDVTYTGGRVSIRLRLLSPPDQHILVEGARPVRTGVRTVQHFPILGLLPPPVDGRSDITELYVSRYGEPKPGTAIWIRASRYTDGWTDAPKVFRFRINASAA